MSILAIIANSQATDIHPELQQAESWAESAATFGSKMMASGIDPSLALATIAAVPVILKVLNMINQFTVAAIDDWKEGNAIRRERERMEIERERSMPPPVPAQTVASVRPAHPRGVRPVQ